MGAVEIVDRILQAERQGFPQACVACGHGLDASGAGEHFPGCPNETPSGGYSLAELELVAAIFSGDYDHLTAAELRERFPEAGAARERRLRGDDAATTIAQYICSAPRGESKVVKCGRITEVEHVGDGPLESPCCPEHDVVMDLGGVREPDPARPLLQGERP